jgi:hypothetical protein
LEEEEEGKTTGCHGDVGVDTRVVTFLARILYKYTISTLSMNSQKDTRISFQCENSEGWKIQLPT